MLYQIFGLPIFIKNIDEKLYNKKEIIKNIQSNYKKNKKRNNWDNEFEKSDIHHSYNDWNNPEFKKINYAKLIPIYEVVFKEFFNFISLKKQIKFKFEILNYTCMTSSQFMKSHHHVKADFTAIHYIKFDNKVHKPTLFENSHVFSDYANFLSPHLKDILNENSHTNSWFYKNFFMNIKENDICITPGFTFHSVPHQSKTDKTRITIVSNINIE